MIRFLAAKLARLDERDAFGAAPRRIAASNRLPAIATLLSELIVKSGATPKDAP